MTRVRFSPHLFALLAFATLIAAPLTAPGYFMFAHDARHTVYFMQMFDAALRDGAVFPRWATDMVFGYGYPLWLILAPLPYFFAEAFHLVGLDFPASIKAVEIVGWFASGVGMYIFAARWLGKDAGLVAGLAYLFVPYHIVDLYVRGAMPEFFAFVFPPFILWGIYEIIAARRVRFVPIAALAYAGLILTHIAMGVLFSPVIAGYIVVLALGQGQEEAEGRKQEAESTQPPSLPPPASRRLPTRFRLPSPFWLALLALLWGFGLAAVFLLPVLTEQKYLTSDPLIGGFFDFRLHFVNPSELISPLWGYGYAGVNGADQFALQLGILPVLLGAITLFTLKRGEAVSAQLWYFAIVVAVAVVLMLSISQPFWELVAPVVAFAQFPWRLLFVTASALAILAGAVVRVVAAGSANPSTPFYAALVLSLLLAFSMFAFSHPQYTDTQFTWNTLMDFEVNSRELLGDTIWTQTRPQDSPLVAQYRAGNITTKAVVVEGQGEIQLVERRPLGDTIQVNAATPVRVMFYTRDFPGWAATVDGNSVEITHDNEQGLITVSVPAGSHTVTTRWGTTAPRVIGAVISIFSVIAAGVWIWWIRNKPMTRVTQ